VRGRAGEIPWQFLSFVTGFKNVSADPALEACLLPLCCHRTCPQKTKSISEIVCRKLAQKELNFYRCVHEILKGKIPKNAQPKAGRSQVKTFHGNFGNSCELECQGLLRNTSSKAAHMRKC